MAAGAGPGGDAIDLASSCRCARHPPGFRDGRRVPSPAATSAARRWPARAELPVQVIHHGDFAGFEALARVGEEGTVQASIGGCRPVAANLAGTNGNIVLLHVPSLDRVKTIAVTPRESRLLSEVWGPSHQGDAHYLRVAIASLRKKLSHAGGQPHIIRTVPKLGYVLDQDKRQ
ncbi:winged helix-turn-helix domain-containing protein [Cupriavidus basilensis]|uniref:winged helix-turn-helix domain-containing protein n=1 Tax=Cupriavidus basilensis TaxID=68895 RepID=UPI0039F6FEB8